MNEQFRSILIGTVGLDILLVIAGLLTISRGGVRDGAVPIRAAVRLSVGAIAVQSTHFLEEAVTGFHARFPGLLGLLPWPVGFFVSLNVFWLAIWGLSVRGLVARRWIALFPLWFLGVGCVANALVHPGFVLVTGSYFPGLVTSPVAGVVGVLLLRSLVRITGGFDAGARLHGQVEAGGDPVNGTRVGEGGDDHTLLADIPGELTTDARYRDAPPPAAACG